MPAVQSSEIKFYLSSSSPSIGGSIADSGNDIQSGALHNLFDVVDSTESASPGQTAYRCFFVKNTNTSVTLQDAKVYFNESDLGANNSVAMAVAGEGVNSSVQQLADEETAPTTGSPSFTTPTSEETALTIGNIPAGEYQGIWIQRTITGGAPAANALDFSVTVFGNTGA